MLDQKEEPDSHFEVYTLNKDGSGFSAHVLVGEEAIGEQEWIWNAPAQRLSFSLSRMTASASLVGPNTIQMLNLAGANQITEIQTLKFTAAGIEVLFRKQNSVIHLLFCRKPMWRPKPMRGQARRWCGVASTPELMSWENQFLHLCLSDMFPLATPWFLRWGGNEQI